MDVRSPSAPQRVILLTTYYKDVARGRNLGTPGYSYEFVARLFKPLLEKWGEVVEVRQPDADLDRLAEQARSQGKTPIHVCFRAFQDTVLSKVASNVVVPAWEFPDVPDHDFDNEPRNNWVAMGNRCDQVIVGGPFTKDIFERAGMTIPIHIVPVPTPDDYFRVPAWAPEATLTLDCAGFYFPGTDRAEPANAAAPPSSMPHPSRLRRIVGSVSRLARRIYKQVVRPWVPRRLENAFTAGYLAAENAYRQSGYLCPLVRPLDLSGIVYTSIFSPVDGRKNWQDLLTAFLLALGDRPDATLVLKLISNNLLDINRVVDFYLQTALPHRGKVIIIKDFLSDKDMLRLAQATTFYVQPTRAEGNCLPLMNHLAAARPSLSPVHTAIGDYFDEEIGFAIESHPEPCSWPQDNTHRTRSSWHRLVWTSLAEQLRASYRLAKDDLSAYQDMAQKARQRLHGWARTEAVQRRLDAAMSQLCDALVPRMRRAA